MSAVNNIATVLESQEITLKPRDLMIIGCVAGVGLGVGAFGILTYLMTNNNNNSKKKHSRNSITTNGPSLYPNGSRPEIDTTDDNNNPYDAGLSLISPRGHTGGNNTMRGLSRNLSNIPSGVPGISGIASASGAPSLSRRFSLLGYSDATLFKAISEMSPEDQVKQLKQQNTKLNNLLTMTENMHYNPDNTDALTPSDIETIRAIFDSIDTDEDGCISGIEQIVELYSVLGEPITESEAKKLVKNKKLVPDNSGQIAFSNFLPFWQATHRGGKVNKYYSQKFKFISAKLKGDFDISNIVISRAGRKATTEFRINFYYKLKSGQSQRISPWHDIPLHHLTGLEHKRESHSNNTDNSKNTTVKKHKQTKIYNFVCEVPKWTRAKYEIATGEPYNPIHQDVKNGKLRYYQHGDMMFNYGALPQTWEDPNHIPPETGAPGDNDPIDVIEIGTRQLPTGSVTAVKILGVLALLDSGETDWKLLAINISDELATRLNDVHDIENVMPGAIKAIREYLRIYKVCTGKSENKYAFHGEALNQEFAIKVIEETHEMWKKKISDSLGDDATIFDGDALSRGVSKGTILTV